MSLPSQLTGPTALAYLKSVQDEIAMYNAAISYLEGLSIATANVSGASVQELVDIGQIIGYPLPTISVTPTTGFILSDVTLYPQTSTAFGLGDNVSTGGALTDATSSGSISTITAAMYRSALTIVAKIKANKGLTIAMIDALGAAFSRNYNIALSGNVGSNYFTLSDSAGYPQATTTIGFGDITGANGGILADAPFAYGGIITSCDISLLIYDNIGAIQIGIMQNIAALFSTSPQVFVVQRF
jgi:hypothetical protein